MVLSLSCHFAFELDQYNDFMNRLVATSGELMLVISEQ